MPCALILNANIGGFVFYFLHSFSALTRKILYSLRLKTKTKDK